MSTIETITETIRLTGEKITVLGDILPDADMSRNLGAADSRFSNLYVQNLVTTKVYANVSYIDLTSTATTGATTYTWSSLKISGNVPVDSTTSDTQLASGVYAVDLNNASELFTPMLVYTPSSSADGKVFLVTANLTLTTTVEPVSEIALAFFKNGLISTSPDVSGIIVHSYASMKMLRNTQTSIGTTFITTLNANDKLGIKLSNVDNSTERTVLTVLQWTVTEL